MPLNKNYTVLNCNAYWNSDRFADLHNKLVKYNLSSDRVLPADARLNSYMDVRRLLINGKNDVGSNIVSHTAIILLVFTYA